MPDEARTDVQPQAVIDAPTGEVVIRRNEDGDLFIAPGKLEEDDAFCLPLDAIMPALRILGFSRVDVWPDNAR